MSLLVAIIIGIAIGLAGGFLLPENIEHLLMNVLMGICGSILGLAFYAAFLGQPSLSTQASHPLIDIRSALTSAVGALIFVMAFDGIQKLTSRNVSHVGDVENGDVDIDKLDKP